MISKNNGWTPAQHAANLNHLNNMNLLLENGANLDIPDSTGRNCYANMIINDHVEMLEAVYPLAIRFQM